LPYIGNTPAEKYAAFNVQHFTTSATTSYTLTHAVANELDIRLVLNNVVQQPGASYAYTASATTLTLSVATTGTDTMYAVYIGKAVQTVTPPDGSVSESKLQVSNSPTNGYVLSAQSAASGGLTWAADAAGTITAFTNGVDNRVVTATSATALNGEANLTFDGTTLLASEGASGATAHAESDTIVMDSAAAANGLSILSPTSGYGTIAFGDSGDNNIGQIFYEHSNDKMYFYTNAASAMTIDSAGIVTKPLQSSFMTSQTSALSVANGATMFSSGTTERWDINSDLSGSTFTAPVTGKYMLVYNMLYESVSTDAVFEDVIVTSNRSYAMWRNSRGYSSGTGYVYNALSVIADMDASDTAYCQHGGGATAAVHASNANYPWFQGYLLG